MTTIPLKTNTIRTYLGHDSFNSCREISSIRCKPTSDAREALVKAIIPTQTTSKGVYDTWVQIYRDGSKISRSGCNCPQGGGIAKCKHVYKVLCRIAQGRPLPGPTPQELAERARQQRRAEQLEHASVYIALTCRSEFDSGSDYHRSRYCKDNVDQEILGIFFSKRAANECAKEYYLEMYGDWDDEEEDDKGESSMDCSDDELTYVYDGSDDVDMLDDEHMFRKIWIERRAIEDASLKFHK